jgi:hypothetical protein
MIETYMGYDIQAWLKERFFKFSFEVSSAAASLKFSIGKLLKTLGP